MKQKQEDEGESMYHLFCITVYSELTMSTQPIAHVKIVDISGDDFESRELMQGESRWRAVWGELEE
jgi:hypothetical protein